MRYLDDEWMMAAGEALADMDPVAANLVAGFQVLTDDLDSLTSSALPGLSSQSVSYSIRLGPGPVALEPGIDEANLVFLAGKRLASEIALGKRSAQRAFLDGELRVEGDVNLLLGYSKEFAEIGDRLAELRRRTTFPES